MATFTLTVSFYLKQLIRNSCCIGNLKHAIMKSRRSFSYHIVPVFIAAPYGALIHLNASMEEIHIAHNDVYRLLFKLPRGLISVSQHFVTAGIPNFTMIRRRHMYSLYKRILSSSNVIINAITDSFTFISTSTLYQEWRRETILNLYVGVYL